MEIIYIPAGTPWTPLLRINITSTDDYLFHFFILLIFALFSFHSLFFLLCLCVLVCVLALFPLV